MHAAIIFTALFCASAQARVDFFSEGRDFDSSKNYSFQVVSDHELKNVVSSAVKAIERFSRAPDWKAEQKLVAIQQTVEKVHVYRARSWSRSPATEHDLDLQIGPFESFPDAIQFNPKECTSYYSRIRNEWEPTASGQELVKPGVKKALQILKTICQ